MHAGSSLGEVRTPRPALSTCAPQSQPTHDSIAGIVRLTAFYVTYQGPFPDAASRSTSAHQPDVQQRPGGCQPSSRRVCETPALGGASRSCEHLCTGSRQTAFPAVASAASASSDVVTLSTRSAPAHSVFSRANLHSRPRAGKCIQAAGHGPACSFHSISSTDIERGGPLWGQQCRSLCAPSSAIADVLCGRHSRRRWLAQRAASAGSRCRGGKRLRSKRREIWVPLATSGIRIGPWPFLVGQSFVIGFLYVIPLADCWQALILMRALHSTCRNGTKRSRSARIFFFSYRAISSC